jgi:hypothetical protein
MCEVARHELALAAPSLGADQVHQCAALAGAPGGDVEQRENRCDATPCLALVARESAQRRRAAVARQRDAEFIDRALAA